MKVAVIGGTGDFGLALAQRLAEAGDDVVIGSRDAERAQEKAAQIGCRGERNEAAAGGADLIVLATAADAAVQTAQQLRSFLIAPVLSVASELEFFSRWARPPAETHSVAERIAQVVQVPVAAGLHSLAAGKLAPYWRAMASVASSRGNTCRPAHRVRRHPRVLELAAKVVTGRALDAGSLACARALEGMTAVIVNLNKRYKGHAGISVTGLP